MRFHFLWLRDNAPNSHSSNAQKLHESNTIESSIRPKNLAVDDYGLRVVWNDNTHAEYPVPFLCEHAYDVPENNNTPATLWDSSIAVSASVHQYHEVRVNSIARRNWLNDVVTNGFSLLANVPAESGKILEVVELFGHVRETNYGKLFDVKVQEAANNLAYTDRPLSVHTDNPYRDPCPTLQLLHCLRQGDSGGITALVDGFAAAEKLRKIDPKAFKLLSEQEVTFRYESGDAILEAESKIINLNKAGRPKSIRINNRSLAPLKIKFDIMLSYYEALFKFRSLLEDQSSQFRFCMQAGDLALFDNERVLHGRFGRSTGERHLQGCYAERDGLMSTLKTLYRTES